MPDITTTPYRCDGQNVYADGALLGWYWPSETPKQHDENRRSDALCKPGVHADRPIHAYPLFSVGPATHHPTPADAIEALMAARERPNREQVEIYDSLRQPEPGVAEAVAYARTALARRSTKPTPK